MRQLVALLLAIESPLNRNNIIHKLKLECGERVEIENEEFFTFPKPTFFCVRAESLC